MHTQNICVIYDLQEIVKVWDSALRSGTPGHVLQDTLPLSLSCPFIMTETHDFFYHYCCGVTKFQRPETSSAGLVSKVSLFLSDLLLTVILH